MPERRRNRRRLDDWTIPGARTVPSGRTTVPQRRVGLDARAGGLRQPANGPAERWRSENPSCSRGAERADGNTRPTDGAVLDTNHPMVLA